MDSVNPSKDLFIKPQIQAAFFSWNLFIHTLLSNDLGDNVSCWCFFPLPFSTCLTIYFTVHSINISIIFESLFWFLITFNTFQFSLFTTKNITLSSPSSSVPHNFHYPQYHGFISNDSDLILTITKASIDPSKTVPELEDYSSDDMVDE